MDGEQAKGLSANTVTRLKAFDSTLKRFQNQYPKAMENLEKDREELLAFYDFPAIH